MKHQFDRSMSPGTEAPDIEDLRQMRKDAKRLNSGIIEHLKEFQEPNDSFKTLPTIAYSAPDPDISVGSTCTALMALLATGQHKKLLSKIPGSAKGAAVDIAKLLETLVKVKWESSGLPDGNWFTTALVMRTVGFAVKAKVLTPDQVSAFRHDRHDSTDEKGQPFVDETVADKSLSELIALKLRESEDPPKTKGWFAVSKYPSKATIAYWFVDGAISAGIDLGKSLQLIASWATQQFHQQLIYISAGNDSLMDPPELAMAACLIRRLQRLCNERPDLLELSRSLPSQSELRFAIELALSQQSESGIWHKYFPLFHFPRGGGAADYCFSFEFLEAVLAEFGSSALQTKKFVDAFRRSLAWCDGHMLRFATSETTQYTGWNSGGEVSSLAKGMPESWATASVHMFLVRLHRSISDLLSDLVLKRFVIDRKTVIKSPDRLDGLIDIDITFPNESPTTLLTVLRTELIKNAKDVAFDSSLSKPRSVLFFGPPGTSKTGLAKAIAEILGWPIVVITPSNFLSRGLEQVHALVDEVFTDLMDLRKTVVFFDEMDALAQSREERTGEEAKESLDVTRQLLTTSMLPKLSDLWDRAEVIFLMATNHKEQLDPAITRANRFDLLLCVSPPPWSRKRSADKLAKILDVANEFKVEEQLSRLVQSGSKTESLLDLFTVSELGVFFDHLKRTRNVTSLLRALESFKDPDVFATAVGSWAKDGITLRKSEVVALKEFKKDLKASRRQYYLKESAIAEIEETRETSEPQSETPARAARARAKQAGTRTRAANPRRRGRK